MRELMVLFGSLFGLIVLLSVYKAARVLLTPSIMIESLALDVGNTLAERYCMAAEEAGEGGVPDDLIAHIKECAFNAIGYYDDLRRSRGGGMGSKEIDEKLAEDAARLTGERYGQLAKTESDRAQAR